MTKLSPCPRCGSFLPHASRVCPGCSRPLARAPRIPAPVRALLAVGGGGLLSVTLSACYGAPCAGDACYEPYPPTCTDLSEDLDGDGYCLEQDCDETNPDVHEGSMCPQTGDGGLTDGGLSDDAGFSDGGPSDGGQTDGGLSDGGQADAGLSDGGETDGGETDGGELSDGGL